MLSLLIEGGRIWRSVSIERGHRSREKRVKVADCAKDSSDVLEILKSSVGNYDVQVLIRSAHAQTHVFSR